MNTLRDQLCKDSISTQERIALLGTLIDKATDDFSEGGLREAADAGEHFVLTVRDGDQIAVVRYYLANAYAGLRLIAARRRSDRDMPWEDKDLEKELVNLRVAFQLCKVTSVSEYETDLPFRIATNLGNALNHIGRFAEAVEMWDYITNHCPDFAMARGNRGYGLYYYSNVLYDPGHRLVFLTEARGELEQALKGKLEGGAREAFEECLSEILRVLSSYGEMSLKEFPLGRSRREREYRTWTLSKRLFVNPLNDLGTQSIAARDVLTLPSTTTPVGEPPHLYGLFNQMKQEFVSARFLLFEGITEQRRSPHFSDREVLLYNTLDYPCYAISVEKVKVAFMWTCSVLDKIAFLLNHYFKLGIPADRVSFRTLWYERKKRRPVLRPEFASSRNWPLRRLFWLSKDFYEDDVDFKESIDPDAKELWEIRNHMVHKYLKVHDDLFSCKELGSADFFVDRLCFSVRRGELFSKAVKLFKLVRSALIYCSLAVHFEEMCRHRQQGNGMVMPMPLDVIEDRWKL